MHPQISSISVSRAAVVEQARSLVGLPFRFYGRSREKGLDCVGVVLVTGWELGVLPADCRIPDYPFPVSREAFAAFDEYFDERDGYEEGRVVIWQKRGTPMHVGILTFQDRWRCVGVDWSYARRHVTCYTPTGIDAWKFYDFRGVE